MTIYHGDIKEDEPLAWDFNTNSAAAAPITLAGSASLAVYKDGGTTQSTAGLTLTVDLDSVTGLHHIAVVTTNAFYVTGSDYSVVLAAGTVDSISVVGVVVGSFSIENRSVAAVKTDTAAILVDTAVIGAYGAGLTALATAANLATVDTVVDSILVDTAEIGSAGAGLTALATAANLATVDTVVDSILVDTAVIGAGGAGLTALATAANLATVDTVVDSILVDTGTTLPASIATVDTVVDSILVDTAVIGAGGAGLTALATAANLATVDTVVDSILVDSAELQTDWANGGRLDVILDTAAAGGGGGGGGGDATEAKQDTIIANLATVDTVVDSILVDTGTTLPASIAVMDANVDQIETAVITNATGTDIAADIIAMKAETVLIVADTNDLETDWRNGGRLDVILDTAATAAGGDATEAKQDTILANLATVDTVVDAILVDTAVIGVAGAGLTALATAANLAAVDTVVDAILVDTGTTLPASIATVDGNVDSILVDTGTTLPAAIAVVDANVDSILVDTGTTLPAAIAVVDANVDQIETAVITNAAGTDIAADIIALDSKVVAVDTVVDAILVDTGTTLPASIAVVDANVDAVLLDTAVIGAGGAGLTALATAANLATVDTIVDSILVDTGTTIPAAIAVMDANVDQIETAVITNATGTDIAADIIALKAETVLIVSDTNELELDWKNGGRLDLLLDAILVDTGTSIGAKIDTIDANVDAILLDTGTTLPQAIAVMDANVDQIETAVITNAAGTDIAADIIALKAETVLIVGDTSEIQGDWVNGGRLDLLLDAIPTTAMRGTNYASLASVCTEARLAELDSANLPADIADIPTLSEFNARTLVSSSYFDASSDVVARVTLCDTTTAAAVSDKTGFSLSSAAYNAAADAYLDRANGIETGYTPRQMQRLIGATCVGILSGAAGTTVTIRDVADTVDRVVMTVDANGNRSSPVYVLT